MKEAFFLTTALLAALYIREFKISFHPFRVSMDGWLDLVAAIFLVVALLFFRISAHDDGYRKGVKDGVSESIRILREKVNEYNENVKAKEVEDGTSDCREL